MTAKNLMIVGGTFGVLFTIVGLIPGAPYTDSVAFAAGALFGKGYGIWEERGRRRQP